MPETIWPVTVPVPIVQHRFGAVFVLSNLLGGTMAHEVAHSLGLADFDGGRVLQQWRRTNRLMDSGFNRPLRSALSFSTRPRDLCRGNYQF